MPRMTGGQTVVAALEREGVDVAFGIPGVHTLEIYDALVDSDVRHVTTRHEQGAGFMADGYARATGRPGVALLITGPGLTNAATPIAQAYSDSSPMLVISSQNETNECDRGKGLLHELRDQQGAMEGIAAESRRIERVADVPDAVAAAFDRFATHRPRPVHLEIPTDVLEREEQITLPERERDRTLSPPEPDERRVEAAVDRLAEADAPLLLLGGGAANAAEPARRLVEATGIPVAATVAGKGVVPDDHPLSLGATLRSDPVADFVESRDLVLAVGTELSPVDTGDAALPEALVHVDVDFATIGRNYPADLGIVADARATLAEIVRLAEERGIVGGEDHRPAVADAKPTPASDPASIAAGGDERHRVLAVLRDALDDDAVIVNDMTKLCYEAQGRLPVAEPGTFLFPRGYGTLGFSPPAAYGAALGLDDRRVVSLVGDGGFMFTVQDLATAVKYELGLPVVVLNDESYDVVKDVQLRRYDRSAETDIENPDFVDLARSFGAAARRIDTTDIEVELPDALDEAFARDRPTVVEVPVEF